MRRIATLLLAICIHRVRDVACSCTFPQYLQKSTSDGKDRRWISETKFLDNTYLWDTQLEVSVDENMIVAHTVHKAQCNEYSETVPCIHRQLSYRLVCVANHGDGKFRVHHRDDRDSFYSCIRFVPRGKNVVQVWTGTHHENDNEELCSDHLLQRQEWPWLTPTLDSWNFCPLTGGFDYRTYMFKRRKLCHKMWRPSRLESECVPGEGLLFSFPDKACSPYADHREDVKMRCWGSWEEDRFLFIVAAEPDKMPQYVLRFPRDWHAQREFTVDLYFSPLCPLDRQAALAANTDVRYAELKMKRSEPGMCFDESDTCSRYKKECTKSPLHQYANYCKRSCGLCELLPSTSSECRFPAQYRGEWNLFEEDRQERVRVHSGRVDFSKMGKFICKSKHWETNKYKMLSYYTNGCRPRYTCIHFRHQDGDMTLQYQISKSEERDISFDLCEFKDDPAPLNGLIRSDKLKVLLPASITYPNTCGLHGNIRVNASLPEGYRCSGRLSDWIPENCDSKPVMTLTLPGCDGGYDIIKDFKCVSYINMHDGLSFLITQDTNMEDKYSCWMIQTYPERMNYKPWKEAYLLPRAQCGLETDMDPNIRRIARMTLEIPTDKVDKPCKQTPLELPETLSAGPATKEERETQSDKDENSKHLYWGVSKATNSMQRTSSPTTLLSLWIVLLALKSWLHLT